jgi:hypothetical protein
VVRHGLGEHGLAGSRGAVQKHTAGRVDADLAVQIEVRKRQLDGFADFLRG